MFRLQKTAFTLMALFLFAVGSVGVAHAQSTALNGLITQTSLNPCPDPPACNNVTAVQSNAASNFTFGFRNLNAPPVPFTLYNRVERPSGGNGGTDGARLYSDSTFASGDNPSAFFNNQSMAGGNTAGSAPAPGQPYMLVTTGGATPPGAGNSPSSSVVRYTATGTSIVSFIGFFQNDTLNGSALVQYSVNGGALINLGTATNAVQSFMFNQLLTAGQTVDFIFTDTIGNAGNITRFNVTAIPEPGTLLLVGISTLGVALGARRLRKKDQGLPGDDDGACSV